MRRRVHELHFVDVVDVGQLLDALGQDVAPVAERIQKLLLPSYFPGAYCPHIITDQAYNCLLMKRALVQSSTWHL